MITPLPSSIGGAGRVAVLAVAIGVQAGRALGQEPTGRFAVTTRGGAITFDRAARLKVAPVIGLDAEYGVSRLLGVGISANVLRASTRPEDFLTTITFGAASAGDTTFFYRTGQAINAIQATVLGVLRMPTGRVTPFLAAGGGAYVLFLDPQVNRGVARKSGPSAMAGGGFSVRFSERAGIQFDVRDVMLFDYDPEVLQPSGGRNPNVLFVEDFPTPPEPKSTVHNFMFTLGFRYVPGGRDIDDVPIDRRPPDRNRPPGNAGGER